jgi:biopolymer transport protein ExbB
LNTVEAIKQLMLDSGAAWVLWLLAGLSIASVAVAIERWLFYRRSTGDTRALAHELQSRLDSGDVAAATRWLQASKSVSARVAGAGLRLAERGETAASKAMLSRTALEREALDQRLAFLGTLGNNAPFIGLLGTVIGVIQAFEELGHSAAGHSAEGGASQVASGAVMSAIAEALVVTAIGLAVALPAVAAYNYLQRRVESMLSGSEVLSNLVLAYLASGDVAEGAAALEESVISPSEGS